MVCLILQGLTTLSFIVGTWALARGAGVPARARLAANCMAAMAFTQVRRTLHSSQSLPPLKEILTHRRG